jgi:hypothetical protein
MLVLTDMANAHFRLGRREMLRKLALEQDPELLAKYDAAYQEDRKNYRIPLKSKRKAKVLREILERRDN